MISPLGLLVVVPWSHEKNQSRRGLGHSPISLTPLSAEGSRSPGWCSFEAQISRLVLLWGKRSPQSRPSTVGLEIKLLQHNQECFGQNCWPLFSNTVLL